MLKLIESASGISKAQETCPIQHCLLSGADKVGCSFWHSCVEMACCYLVNAEVHAERRGNELCAEETPKTLGIVASHSQTDNYNNMMMSFFQRCRSRVHNSDEFVDEELL